jgi:hypothetical protein
MEYHKIPKADLGMGPVPGEAEDPVKTRVEKDEKV